MAHVAYIMLIMSNFFQIMRCGTIGSVNQLPL